MGTGTKSQGTRVYIENSGSPQSYLLVAGLNSIAPVRSNTQADTTNYEDTHETTLSVLKATTFQLVYNYKADDLAQVEIEAALADGLDRNFRYVYSQLSPTKTYTFAAKVESIADAPAIKGIITKTVVLRVQADPTVS